MKRVDELLGYRRLRRDHVIREEEDKRLAANDVADGENGVADTTLFLLADVSDVRQAADTPKLLQPRLIALGLERALKVPGAVEVVFDDVLARRHDDDDLVEARLNGLFNRVLDGRLINDWQDRLGLRLRGRKKPRAVACRKDDGLA